MRREMTVVRRPEGSGLKVAAVVAAFLAAGLPGLPGLPAPAAARAAPRPARATASPLTAGAALQGAGDAAGGPFCQGLGKRYLASSAAWAFCKGPQPHGPSRPPAHAPAAGHPAPGAPGNAHAARPAEDVSPGRVRGYGQSDTPIAASGRSVVEAW